MSAQTHSYLSDRVHETLGEDWKYREEVLTRYPRVFFRPGNRTDPANSRYIRADSNGFSYIGFIERYGSHDAQIPPEIRESVPIRIVNRTCKRISDITDEECAAAYAELHSSEDVLKWLQKKYLQESLTQHSLVTVHTVAFVL